MEHSDIATLLRLGGAISAAVGAVLLLLRLSERAVAYRSGIVEGYPPSLFPAQDLTGAGALAALAAAQARLLSAYEQAPPRSDLAIWLRAFLHELREIMDTAYRAAVIAQIYGRPIPLDRLVGEVQQIEAQLAAQLVERLLAREADAHDELLEGRLATLRLCVRELASAGGATMPAGGAAARPGPAAEPAPAAAAAPGSSRRLRRRGIAPGQMRSARRSARARRRLA